MKPSFKHSTFVFFLLPTSVLAGGFHLPQAAYANLGTAGAGDGVYTGSAASIWSNPAINSFIEEDIFTVNGLVLGLSNKYYDYENAADNSGESGGLLGAAGIFYTQNLNEQWSAGLAVATIGGSALDYGHYWAGADQIVDVSLVTMQINPSLSYKVNDRFSIGAGVQANYGAIEGGMQGPMGRPIDLEAGTDWAFGYNLGMAYQWNEQTITGLSYRSKLEHEFSETISMVNQQGNYVVGLDSAAFARADISHELNSDLKLLGSITWTQWSDLQETPVSINGNNALTVERNWKDTWAYAVGVDYRLNAKTRLKLGISYETSPLDDAQYQTPDLPVDRQIRYSAGVSTIINTVPVDFFYEYADLGTPQIAQVDGLGSNLNGYFDMKAHFVGFAVSF
ncbi:long-chain fatty acid transporter [Alginatibacterium sediminis]|uniref:Long-chain fatty acid transporter n=1 Tax=Alginatibacterium sediminis TaxID=2164068 RepID=A0A420EL78_9ALTE|nr:outer membrane protein transport protein [Alginatibacterium sediminis]RKF21448.1 long-chain fatty acid transporter [Alginatibacterium sediminis]